MFNVKSSNEVMKVESFERQWAGQQHKKTIETFIKITHFLFPAPTSSLWRRIVSPRPAALPRKPPSVSLPPSAFAMPPCWTHLTTLLPNCLHPVSQWCSHSQWGTTRATAVSGILRYHLLRATASTTRLWAEPMGWVSILQTCLQLEEE